MIDKTKATTLGFYMPHCLTPARAMNDAPSKAPPSALAMPVAEPAPRELKDSEVRAMWAKYPGLTFDDFCDNGQGA